VSDPAAWRDDRVEAERHDTLRAHLRVIFANADRLMIAEPQTAVDLLALDADSLALVTNHNHPQDLAALAATPSIRR
jgi:xanthine/CO dehydrogenase XdhC/CoxF family maturation factor